MITTGRWSLAVVSAIVSGDTVNLVAFPDGAVSWPTSAAFAGDRLTGHVMLSVVKGSTIGTWRDLALPSDTGGTFMVLATAGVDQTALGLNANRTPSATRPTRVRASGTFTTVADASELVGIIELRSDAVATPTTQQDIATSKITLAAGTIVTPWSLEYIVPAGHNYRLVTTVEAGVTVQLSKITEQVG